jgi:hypothetical protein
LLLLGQLGCACSGEGKMNGQADGQDSRHSFLPHVDGSSCRPGNDRGRRSRYVRFKVFLRRSWFGVLGGVLRGKTEPCVSERELSGLELRVTYSPS